MGVVYFYRRPRFRGPGWVDGSISSEWWWVIRPLDRRLYSVTGTGTQPICTCTCHRPPCHVGARSNQSWMHQHLQTTWTTWVRDACERQPTSYCNHWGIVNGLQYCYSFLITASPAPPNRKGQGMLPCLKCLFPGQYCKHAVFPCRGCSVNP